jgi:hypothetical protein
MSKLGFSSALIALLFFVLRLDAQRVVGRTLDGTSSLPLPGVVVMLTDSGGTTLARTVSDTRGVYSLLGDGRGTIIRALHIGFRPATVAIAAASTTEPTLLDVVLTTIPVTLGTVNVREQNGCPGRKDAVAAFALWEQVHTALLATVVAKEAEPANFRVLLYDRTLARDARRVEKQVVLDSIFPGNTAIVSVRPSGDYETRGYMEGAPTNFARSFYIPVAEVFLDSSFLRLHCIGVREGNEGHANDVGLTFEPTARSANLVDVAGTIWVRKQNPTIRSIEYRYTNTDRISSDAGAGGELEFREMPNGVVLADRWRARVPAIAMQTVRLRDRTSTVPIFAGVHELGGEIAEAAWPDGLVWHDTLAEVEGTVVQESDHNPIRGLYVRLKGDRFDAETDSLGHFWFPKLIPGPYEVEALDTVFAQFGVLPKASKAFILGRDSSARVLLELPSRKKTVTAICAFSATSRADSAQDDHLLAGKVTLPNGVRVADARLDIHWPISGTTASRVYNTVRADSIGSFIICGLPRNTPITIAAGRDSLISEDNHVFFKPETLIADIALTIGRPDSRLLTDYRKRQIIVIDSTSSRPLADVEIADALNGEVRARTNPDGVAMLAAFPEGRSLLRIRKLGFEPFIQLIEISSNAMAPLRVALLTVEQLATVQITASAVAASSRRAVRSGFAERASQHVGHFAFANDFDKIGTATPMSIFTMMGMRQLHTALGTILSGGHFAGNCPVTVYVDDVLYYQRGFGDPPTVETMLASEYAGAEYYASAADTPAKYNATGSGCGTLILWTKD